MNTVGMALDATDALFFEVNLVPRRIDHLEPAGLMAAVAFEAGLVRYTGMLYDPVRALESVFHDEIHTFNRTLLVAGMAVDIAVLAGAPALPGFFHGMA